MSRKPKKHPPGYVGSFKRKRRVSNRYLNKRQQAAHSSAYDSAGNQTYLSTRDKTRP